MEEPKIRVVFEITDTQSRVESKISASIIDILKLQHMMAKFNKEHLEGILEKLGSGIKADATIIGDKNATE